MTTTALRQVKNY